MALPLPKEKQLFRERRRIVISWHRFYDPETGRYLTADPIGLAGGMNLYVYAEGDPINWFDPFGLNRYKVCMEYVDPKDRATCLASVNAFCASRPTINAECCRIDHLSCVEAALENPGFETAMGITCSALLIECQDRCKQLKQPTEKPLPVNTNPHPKSNPPKIRTRPDKWGEKPKVKPEEYQ